MRAGRRQDGVAVGLLQILVIAAHSAAGNALRHGGGRGIPIAWRDAGDPAMLLPRTPSCTRCSMTRSPTP
ncbi:hypothetical protein [Nonomuraea deserti]|uniref:hypothetical protein n=1 Tax=Nonomuraea deserti TaxID=1848322 RepID=UPI001404A00F|nr:hypothetical protein [Nonomuraea deserti]